jgi:arginine utilization protein RocB
MYLNCFNDVKAITESLVNVPSIVRTAGESDCAKRIHEYYRQLPYFQQYPQRLKLVQTVDDEIERYDVIALVKGTKGKSKKTIILMHHLDTVGVDDFGTIKEHAFDPDTLPELLRELNVSDEVKEDIASGEYMFGRGALDMKAGAAGHMYLIKYFSEHPEEIDGNIVALAECDEEDNSHGVLTALQVFQQMAKEEGLEYIACVNADYTTPYYPGDENRYVYFGSIGKLLPSFFVVGKETHVGQAYGGLDPNLVVAELTKLIELNTELCDESQGEVTIPPISLKQADFKKQYTVQTPLAAYSYYNFFTHSMSPAQVMEKVKEKAVEAFSNVISHTNYSYRKYCEISGLPYKELPWKSRVYTWEEFYNELKEQHGDKFTNEIYNFAKQLNQKEPTMDLRVFSVKVIEEAWKWVKDKSPAIIIYFSSTFSARIEMTGKTEKERELLDAVRNSVDLVQEKCPNPIKIRMFYPYISDSSFMAVSDDMEGLKALENNMPAWGTKYFYNVDDVLAINVPVVNIGTHGKDGHKVTERVHMRYTFENVPNMTYHTIKSLLK